jgi:hypothetical protein
MAQVRRWYIGMVRGRVRCNFSWKAINHQSVVLISAAEGRRDARTAGSTADPERFVGAANVTVRNIAPYGTAPGEGLEPKDGGVVGGGVEFVIDVEWHDPRPIWADIALMDEIPKWFAFSE